MYRLTGRLELLKLNSNKQVSRVNKHEINTIISYLLTIHKSHSWEKNTMYIHGTKLNETKKEKMEHYLLVHGVREERVGVGTNCILFGRISSWLW